MDQHEHRLEAAIDNLVEAVRSAEHPGPTGLWAVASVCHRLSITFALSEAGDPTTASEDVGSEWASVLIERLDDYPDERAETLKVAWSVVQQLVRAVQERGLVRPRATGRRSAA